MKKAERGKNAQLAYSFEISLQNEFSLEENIALAREFLFREFVSRGMTVDVSFHEKECEDGGTPNPHFHFLCPIRPMEQDGTWGIKQRREYVLDEEGNRIRDTACTGTAQKLERLEKQKEVSGERRPRTEMTELMEHIFSLSEVQRAVRHMAITHINQASREKELKADGTISSERHAD